MNKEDVILNFKEMIENSWTYEKMTTEEKEKWNNLLESGRLKEATKGSVKHRWEVLYAIYEAYLIGIGYDNFNWRNESIN